MVDLPNAVAPNMRIEEHFSAGGVVYRKDEDRIDLILCGRDRPPLWGLPKGTPDAGETAEQTAEREVREETGLEVDIETDLGEIEYWFYKPGARVHKRVKFYLMSFKGGNTDDHDPEFDHVAWFPSDVALERATHATEAGMLREAIRQVRGQ